MEDDSYTGIKRFLTPTMVKCSASSLEEFMTLLIEYEKKELKNFVEKQIISKEEFDAFISNVGYKIKESFKKGDNIILCNDFNESFPKCGRESVVLQRGSVVQTVCLLKMS